jgi:hypothetical protein
MLVFGGIESHGKVIEHKFNLYHKFCKTMSWVLRPKAPLYYACGRILK